MFRKPSLGPSSGLSGPKAADDATKVLAACDTLVVK
jgi:hypothetical protein